MAQSKAGAWNEFVKKYRRRSDGQRSEVMRHDGLHDGWRDDVGMGLVGVLVIIVLLLAAAALVKYLFFSKSR